MLSVLMGDWGLRAGVPGTSPSKLMGSILAAAGSHLAAAKRNYLIGRLQGPSQWLLCSEQGEKSGKPLGRWETRIFPLPWG